jgi:hypothetical protein
VEGLSAVKSVYRVLFIVIPLVGVLVLIMFASNQLPSHCSETVSGDKRLIVSTLSDCASNCWRKHDFGQDLEAEDCLVIQVTPVGFTLENSDLESIHEDAKTQFDFDLEDNTTYRLLLRYNPSEPEISIINYGFCGNEIVERTEVCDTNITDCEFEFGECSGNKRCSDECLCDSDLVCRLCMKFMPTQESPDVNTDWCLYCKMNEEILCDDYFDNDCDGFIDDADSDCSGYEEPPSTGGGGCAKIADYAENNARKVVGDGCFFTSPATVDCSYSPGDSAPNNYIDGSDCAHFASYSLKEGGVDVSCRYDPSTCKPYGEPGANTLRNYLIGQGKGNEVNSIDDLKAGGLIFYDWNNDGFVDHVSVYIGNKKVASHTSNGIFDWQMSSSDADFYFMNIKC